MTNRMFVRLCLGLGLIVGGCTPTTDTAWTQTEAPKRLQVDFVRLRHVAAFVPGRTELAGGEAQRLASFLDSASVGPRDHVYLEPGSEDRLTAARIGLMAKEMDRKGIGAQTLPPGSIPADSMLVVVERYVVTPPNCPNWSGPATGEHSNQPSSNYGCADATNLGLMIADPRDLVIGRDLGPEEGNAGLYAIERYRAGSTKALAPTPSSGAPTPMKDASGEPQGLRGPAGR